MPKGPRLTDAMKRIFQRILIEHDADWTAKEMRNRFRKQFERRYPELARVYPEFPAVNTVEKWRAEWHVEQKKRREVLGKEEPGPLDLPWTVLTLPQYPLPPETLPVVLLVWKYCQTGDDDEVREHPLTVRQARWVAQLSGIIEDPGSLFRESYELSIEERVLEYYPLSSSDQRMPRLWREYDEGLADSVDQTLLEALVELRARSKAKAAEDAEDTAQTEGTE